MKRREEKRREEKREEGNNDFWIKEGMKRAREAGKRGWRES